MQLATILQNTKVQLLLLVIAGALIFTPNGFFSGHRTDILEGKVEKGIVAAYIAPYEGSTKGKGTITGQLTNASGVPISGGLITAFDQTKKRKITTYTHPDGSYELPLTFVGDLTLRARNPYHEDVIKEVTIVDKGELTVGFVTEKLTDIQQVSDSLTASAHATALNWDKVEDKNTFISQCLFCHQIGNGLTRRPRSKDEWQTVVNRMEGYLVMITDDENESVVNALSAAFDGEPIDVIQTYDVSDELPNAVIEEWLSGDALSFIHDAGVGSDGRLYGSDEGKDTIWQLDRETGEITYVKMPDIDLPEGGLFAGMQLPVGVFTGKHGPPSFAEGDDNKLWLTNSLSSTLMAYDTETNEFETFDVGGDSLYLHTIRKDQQGRMWFTVALSNQVGVFDPKTKQLDLLDLPVDSIGQWITDSHMPYLLWFTSFFPKQNLHLTLSHHKWANLGYKVVAMPYGIDINPIDGSVWYVKINANKVGRIDPVTLEIDEFDTPDVGPRRPRFDKNGNLWIPGFEKGVLLKLDTKARAFRTFPLPTLSPTEYETPYALNVHPDSGHIWITSNMSDRVFSFNPKTEEFVSYPLPTKVSYLRDFEFTADGKVCSSNSNLLSYAIEDGLGNFICIDPNKHD